MKQFRRVLACLLILVLSSGFAALAADFENSRSCKEIRETMEDVFGEKVAFNYDEESGLYIALILASEGTSFTLINNKEEIRPNWESLTGSMRELSGAGAEYFSMEGYHVGFAIMMVSDVDADTVLYSCLNGVEVSNAIND